MTMPIYASPEQFMRDRSEYARKGIARGRSVVVTTYSGGVLFVAENHSPTLHKVSEIYDRIGFAAVGRYNEFENLRTAGIRLADVRGLLLRPAGRHRSVAGERLRADRRLDLLRAPEAVRGGALRRRGQRRRRRWRRHARSAPTSCTGSPTTARSSTNGAFVVMGGATEPVITALTASFTAGLGPADRAGRRGQRAGHGRRGRAAGAAAGPTRGGGARSHPGRPNVPPDAGRDPGRAAGRTRARTPRGQHHR